MLGKKKKSEKGIIDDSENSNSLFHNPFLKDYNNKSLVISLQTSKKALDEKDSILRKYKSSTDVYRKIFICIFKKLGQFSQVLSSFKETNQENESNYAEIISSIEKEAKSIMDLFSSLSEGVEANGNIEELLNHLNGFLESIENKITKLITNLLNTKIKKNGISNLIDEVLSEEKIEFFSKEIIEENKSLRKLLENKTNLLEDYLKKPDLNLFEEYEILNKKQNQEIIALNNKLEEMKYSTRRVKQKLASSPYLPFIIVKDFDTVNIKTHNCLCFYCGFEINNPTTNNEGNSTSNNCIGSNTQVSNINNTNHKDFSNNSQIINSNNPPPENSYKDKNNIEDTEIANNNINLPNANQNKNQDIEMKDISNSNNINKNGAQLLQQSVPENINKNCNENSSQINQNQIQSQSKEKEEINPPIRNLFLDPIQNTGMALKNLSCKDPLEKEKDLNLSLNEETDQQAKSPNFSNNNSPENLMDLNQNKNIEILDEESKTNLENLYRKLYNSYLNLKFEKNISYQGLIKSKPFQVLLTQMENCINTIDSQKSEILHMKKHLSEAYGQITSQEKFFKYDKMKDVNLLEEKIEKMQREFSLKESEKQKMQIEINKLEDMIKTIKNFDYTQLTSIDEFYKNKNVDLIEMLKSQAKSNSEKYQIEYEKCESFEKSNLKLQMELDRFKTALSKHESVEGVENLQFEKFDMREREEMKRQIKTYRDKLSNCEKHYKNAKNEIKQEKENSEKLFVEICLNEKTVETMNKTIKDLTSSIQENNEKINYLLTEKSKNAEIIRNLNDYIEKIELQIKEVPEFQKELKDLEDNYIKEINNKSDTIKKYETLLGFKNQNIDFLYEKILQVTKNNLSLDESQQELLKNIESMKLYSSKKITELERAKAGKSITSISNTNKDYSKMNLKFADKKTEEEFEIIKMENDIYKKKLQCKICCIRDIDSIINKCKHTFCKECITNLVNSRQRICPKCRQKISMKDVSEIWID